MTTTKPRSKTTEKKPKMTKATTTTRKTTKNKQKVSADIRLQMIREAAYYKSEKRGFSEGSEYQDWIEAESEIDQLVDA